MSFPGSPARYPTAKAENPSVSVEAMAGQYVETGLPGAEDSDVRRIPTLELCPEHAFTSFMTFDATGAPTLIPLREVDRNMIKSVGLAPEATDSTASSDDIPSEGEVDEEEETSFVCAPCGWTGRQKAAPPAEEQFEEPDLEPHVVGEVTEVMQDHIVSFYTMPSNRTIKLSRSKELSCPQPLVNYLPPSPFCTIDGKLAVDVYAVNADMRDEAELEALPDYTVEPLLLKQQTTLARSSYRPESISLS